MQVGFLQYDVSHVLSENLDRLTRCLEQNPCDLLLLPELSLCGYLFEDRRQLAACAQEVPAGPAVRAVAQLSGRYGRTVVFGLAEKEGDRIYNTAVIVSKGRYIGKYRKIHLSDFEKKYFDPGQENAVFTVDGVRIGVQICFDLWFPEVSRRQIRQGADLLLALANFGGETTCHIARVRAIENLTPLVLCNRVGRETIPGMDAEFLGKSAIINAAGQYLVAAPAGTESTGFAALTFTGRRANVICSDFDREIAFHYPDGR